MKANVVSPGEEDMSVIFFITSRDSQPKGCDPNGSRGDACVNGFAERSWRSTTQSFSFSTFAMLESLWRRGGALKIKMGRAIAPKKLGNPCFTAQCLGTLR